MLILASPWGMFVVRGMLAVTFGLATLLMPRVALLTLVLLFGTFALADGVVALVAAYKQRESGSKPSWALLIAGVVGIVAGLVALVLPGLSAMALVFLIAAWAFVRGVLTVAAAALLRLEIRGEWLLATSGVFSILMGFVLALFPGTGALAMISLIGAYAVIHGVLLVVLGVKLQRLRHFAQHALQGAPIWHS